MPSIRTGNRRRAAAERRALHRKRPMTVIDWGRPGRPSRMHHARPLAPETLSRIANGLMKVINASDRDFVVTGIRVTGA